MCSALSFKFDLFSVSSYNMFGSGHTTILDLQAE